VVFYEKPLTTFLRLLRTYSTAWTSGRPARDSVHTNERGAALVAAAVLDPVPAAAGAVSRS
jgi:hypothetical protein